MHNVLMVNLKLNPGPRWLSELGSHTNLSSIRRGFTPGFVVYKGCTRLAVASDKVYLLIAHGRWFSLDTPASSTTKTGHHEWYSWNNAESGIKHNKSNHEIESDSEVVWVSKVDW